MLWNLKRLFSELICSQPAATKGRQARRLNQSRAFEPIAQIESLEDRRLLAVLDMETVVPPDWSASLGTLAISGKHYKQGVQSLEWNWTGGDSINVSNAAFTAGQRYTVSWVHNPVAQPGQKLTFQFKDANGTVQYSFNYNLGYTGWRRAIRDFEWDMTGPKANLNIASVTIVGPATGSGRLYFDGVEWDAYRFNYLKDTANSETQGIGGVKTNYYDAYFNWTPDIAKTTPTAQELADLQTIRQRWLAGTTIPNPSEAERQSAYQYITDQNIVTDGNEISGKVISRGQLQYWPTAHIKNLGADVFRNNNAQSAAQLSLYLRHWLDQGLDADSSWASASMVDDGSTLNIYFYNADQLGFIFGQQGLDPALKERAWNMMRWMYQMGDLWNPNWRPGGDTDVQYYTSSLRLGTILFLAPDDATSVQWLKGYRRYQERFLIPNDGGGDGIKVDGTGFHHGAYYPAYMGGISAAIDRLAILAYTSFEITPNGYNDLRNAVISDLRRGNRSGLIGYLGNSVSGRHPFGPIAFGGGELVKQWGMIGGHVLGLSGPDPVMARFYNTYWPDYPYAPFAPYGTEGGAEDGFFQSNYAAMGTYRRDDWVVSMRGSHSYFWGAEHYDGQNEMGRYQSYGVAEVLYPGGHGASGHGGAGWNWNMPPGSTTINLPFAQLDSGGRYTYWDTYQDLKFSGSLAFRGEGPYRGGEAGIMATDFKQTKFPGDLLWKKSDFAFGDVIVRLGSDISNGGDPSASPTITTLFQGKLPVTSTPIVVNGTSINTFPYNATSNNSTPDWLLDTYGTGYYVKPGNSLVVSRSTQNSPDGGAGTNYATGDFSAAWLDHGVNPNGAGYEYVLMPGTTSSEMATFAAQMADPQTAPYEVLQKNAAGHVVRWKPDGTIGYSLFQSGKVSEAAARAGVLRAVSQPSLVMTRTNSDGNLFLSLSNPDLNLSGGVSAPVDIELTLVGEWGVLGSPSNAVVTSLTPYVTTIKVTVSKGLPVNLELEGSPITPVNVVARNDSFLAVAGSPSTWNLTNNDFDTLGRSLSLVSVTTPAHGTVSIADAGSVTYTPASNYVGSDQFDYVVRNSDGETSTGTVLVNVIATTDLRASLLVSYQFDDANGSTAVDSSRNAKHGTLMNGPVWTSGKSGGGLSLDGNNDYVDVPTSALSSLGTEISISFWANGNPDRLPGNTSVFYATDAAGNRAFNIHLPWNNSVVYWDAGHSGGVDRISKYATTAETEGRWNHWVFTKNSATGSMSIYLNGALWQSGTGHYRTLATNLRSITIGSGAANYPGVLDDVRIYGKVLTQAQIQALTADAPVITTPPASVTAAEGGSATFSVAATGSGTLSYQWRRNGADIPGATGSTLTIPSISALRDTGAYTAVVSSGMHAVTSAPATLSVIRAPAIVTQPTNQSVLWGGSATLRIDVTGTPLFNYQWYRGSDPIPGATSRNYKINSATSSDIGDYRVVVSNAAGTVTSSIASVSVTNTPPAITSQPTSQFAVAGQSVTLGITTTGTTPMTFQWRKNGVAIAGATSASYVINSASASDAGRYTVVATNVVGSVTSSEAVLSIQPDASLLVQYRFDETSGTRAQDSSGNSRHGTLVNGPAWTSGKAAGAVSFDGSNDYVDVPATAVSSLNNEVSLAFWTYGNAALLPKQSSVVYATNASGQRVFNIHLPWSDGTVYWDAGNATGIDRIAKGASVSQYEGQWNHWVFTKNAVTGSMSIYLNGSLWHSGSGLTKTFNSPITSMRIGGAIGYSYNYPGNVDDFRVYNRALSATDVQTLFTNSQASYTLTYQAGANGTLSGSSSQTVFSGSSGTAITAVPDAGYHFVNWSDGAISNPRFEPYVTSNLNVTALFTSDNSAPSVAIAAAGSPNPVTGTTTALSVLGADDAGEANLTYSWVATPLTAGDPTPTFDVNGTNAAKNATATFTKAGDYRFTVTMTDAQGLSATSSVDVTVQQALTTLTVSPASVNLLRGATQNFAATGADQFGAAFALTSAVTWSASAGTIDSTGRYTAPTTIGNVTITATSGSVSSTASVLVANSVPTIATAAGASPNPVTTGTTTALSVLGADDAGEANLTYSWVATPLTAGDPTPTFNINGTNAAKNATATFAKAGSYRFTVTVSDAQGSSATSSVDVTVSQSLTTLTVSPTSVNLLRGATQNFTAAGTDQFGAPLASAPSITWSASAGTIDSTGRYTAPSTLGNVTITASSSSVSSTAAVLVVNSAPTIATTASGSPNPVTGTTTALSVLGADDAGESNLTYTWAATPLTVGNPTPTFNVNGTNAAKNATATFAKAGAYRFTVTVSDAQGSSVTSSVDVTVQASLTSIVVTPSTATVNVGAKQQFSATGRDQFGQSLAATLTWSATAGTISAAGLYTAPATVGSATIRATSGSIIGTASVTIVVPATKFFVVDSTSDSTFRYQANGKYIASSVLNSGNLNAMGVAASADGSTLWVIDSNRNVYVYSASGSLLGTWTTSGLSTPTGISVTADDVWIVDSGTDRAYRFAGATTRRTGTIAATSNFGLASQNSNPQDLVTDGTTIWVINSAGTDRVYVYQASNGASLGNWAIDTANASPTGITLDPTGASNSLWICDIGTDRVYEYANGRSRRSGSQTALFPFLLASPNGNAQGIADPPASASTSLIAALDSAGSGSRQTSAVSPLTSAITSYGQVGEPPRPQPNFSHPRFDHRPVSRPSSSIAPTKPFEIADTVPSVPQRPHSATVNPTLESALRDVVFSDKTFDWYSQ